MREAIMPCYAPPKQQFVRGEGSYLFTDSGEKYLDFTTGIAVNALGHKHPHLTKVLHEQTDKLWHVSNMFRVPEGERLSERLAKLTFADVAFFANSGAEAVECGIKAMRRYHFERGDTQRTRVIGMSHSFHGRTVASIAASGNAAYCKGFIPSDYHFDQAEFGDIESLKALVNEHTAGVILEPIQGEGGINVAKQDYMNQVRELCDAHGVLLMFDEVQCGVGRTGHLFAYEAFGITPDVMSVAKGIGGGFPLGACLATKAVGQYMVVGTHGSTFGGNPLATAVGNAVLDVVSEPAFLKEVKEKGNYLVEKLEALAKKHPTVYGEITGMGLMLGMKAIPSNDDVLIALRDKYQVLIVKSGGNKLRFLPPLTISYEEIDTLIEALDKVALTF